jgi:predicted small lipoprotein YifL
MRIHRLHSCVASLMLFVLAGCGGKSSGPLCKITAIKVFPTSATVDHTAAPPGNTIQFAAFVATGTPGCEFPLANLTTATWSTTDPTNVSIGATIQGPDYGKATCKGATAGAATVTAVVPASDGTNVSNTASLTCN